jgi:hypothetical protein
LKSKSSALALPLGTVLLAAFLWFVTFFLPWGVFWFKISFSAALLAAIALHQRPPLRRLFRFDLRSLFLGLASAVVLYLIFWLGKLVSTALFPFAQQQIGAIYGKGEGTPMWVIALLLFFVTGPCEEIYWRGFLQQTLSRHFGGWQGWLLATGIYAGVHVWSLNFMLIGAAGVAGAFWGLMYWRLQDLRPVIISHALWSTFVFAAVPIP